MSNSLAIARMERPRSLACCTAFHRTLCRGVGFLRGDAGGLRTLPSPFNVALSASMTPRDAKLSLGWLPTPLTLRSRPGAYRRGPLEARRTPGCGGASCVGIARPRYCTRPTRSSTRPSATFSPAPRRPGRCAGRPDGSPPAVLMQPEAFFPVRRGVGLRRARPAEGVSLLLHLGYAAAGRGHAGAAPDGRPVRAQGAQGEGRPLPPTCGPRFGLQGFGGEADAGVRGEGLPGPVRIAGRGAPQGDAAVAARPRPVLWRGRLAKVAVGACPTATRPSSRPGFFRAHPPSLSGHPSGGGALLDNGGPDGPCLE